MRKYVQRARPVEAALVTGGRRWRWTVHRIAGVEYSAVFPRLLRRLDERPLYAGRWRYWIVGGGQIHEGDYLVARGDSAWREPAWLFKSNYRGVPRRKG